MRGLYGMWARQRQVVSVSSKRGRCVEQRMQLVDFIDEFRVKMSVLRWYSMCGDTEESVLLFTFAVMLRGWRLHNNEAGAGAGARQPPCLQLYLAPAACHSSVTTSNLQLQRTWHSASLWPTQSHSVRRVPITRTRPFVSGHLAPVFPGTRRRACSLQPACTAYALFQTVASSKRLSLA